MKNDILIKIPFGKARIKLSLPGKRVLGILQKRHGAAKDIRKMIDLSFRTPAAKAALKNALGKKKKALIVAPDSTRSAHLEHILPALLKRIKNMVLSVDIIIATGLHKKHDRGQIENLVGKAIAGRVKISSHSQDSSCLERRKSATSLGIPVVLNKKLRECDSLMTVGVIEPHLYAGYSGGAKTIAIGLAGEETINATHNIRFLDDPATAIGSVEANPFQGTLWEILGNSRPIFTVNSVNDSDGRAIAVFSGAIKDVFKNGVKFARDEFEVSVNTQSDIVVAGVGYPKDANLYQASRAINYILDVRRPVLRKGGVLVLAAGLRDGIGEGITEKRFYGALSRMVSPRDFVEKIKRDGCIAGEHRAYMVARPMQDYNIMLVTGAKNILRKKLPFPCFENIKEALAAAEEIAGKAATIYVIPRTLSTIACFNPGARKEHSASSPGVGSQAFKVRLSLE